MTTNRFNDVAATWDKNPKRAKLIDRVYAEVKDQLDISNQKTVLDFGTGTGLFGFKFIDQIKELIFCDSSEEMLNQVKKKIEFYKISNAKVINTDFSESELPVKDVDLITSFQVLHHVDDVQQLLSKFNTVLTTNGQTCWIDLDKEDGTFHDDNTGVAHFGFSKSEVEDYLSTSGFSMIYYNNDMVLKKKTANGTKEFRVFICVAKKHPKSPILDVNISL